MLWFHAPWLHHKDSGREPLRGLTYERPTPPQELASSQTSWLQTWAIGFYNAPGTFNSQESRSLFLSVLSSYYLSGASVFGQVWSDPPRPAWNENVRFPRGSVVFKLLFTDATVEALPFLRGSPEWQAVSFYDRLRGLLTTTSPSTGSTPLNNRTKTRRQLRANVTPPPVLFGYYKWTLQQEMTGPRPAGHSGRLYTMVEVS